MGIDLVFKLLGGLALFLYGMQMMSSNLEAAAGNRMKQILERLTANRFLGVCVGAGITAIIQSSSAMTVMVVGFVNSGLMTLNQAVWIIMGANIGTTITGQMIALDIGVLAPLIAFVGVAMVIFVKNKRVQYAGGIIAGLGVLFIGMGMMSDAMMPLRESEGFIRLMTSFSNPLLGILAGAGFTAIIQSSSASVGILQALAIGGLINIHSAVFVLFGQNIGTCITAVLAAIGTSRNAKRTTLIHLMFNLIGTCTFVVICLTTPFTAWVADFTPGNAAAQIANVHTIFNIVTTLLLLPFGFYLAKAAVKLMPDTKEGKPEEEKWLEDLLISGRHLGVSAIAMKQVHEEVQNMMEKAAWNVEQGFLAVASGDISRLDEIEKNEDEIDRINVTLSRKISKILTVEQTPEYVDAFYHTYTIIGNLERIGDHAVNMADYAKMMQEKSLTLSVAAKKETGEMGALCLKALNLLKKADNMDGEQLLTYIAGLEQETDDTTDQYRLNHMERMKQGVCNIEASIIYSEVLTDYERIGDHILNVAEECAAIEREKGMALGRKLPEGPDAATQS